MISVKYSLESFTTVGLSNAKAIKFGIAIRPFKVSAISQARVSSTVPAIHANKQKITWYTLEALYPNKYSIQRLPYKAQVRTVDNAKRVRQIATATPGRPCPNTDSNPMMVRLAPMLLPYSTF